VRRDQDLPLEAWIVVSAPKVRVEVVDHVMGCGADLFDTNPGKCLGLIVRLLSRRILYFEMAK